MIETTARIHATTGRQKKQRTLTSWLETGHPFFFTLYVSVSAFGLYTCVYAFRKTFAAASFGDMEFLGIDYKVWLVTSQVCGYALSKFSGIKIISELKPLQRSRSILLAVIVSWLSWLLFAIVLMPLNLIFLFTNGLSLGLVWGMVFGFLEGRRMTEILAAALSVSFIFSSGLCRSAGGYLLEFVSETWMPFVASCLFFMPLLIFLFLLDKVPSPTKTDEDLRTKRVPMNRAERMKFLMNFLPGIILFILAYMLLTTFRDFRDNFSAEIWTALGYGNSPGIYTKIEIPVSIILLVLIGLVILVKNNIHALMINHVIIISGLLMVGVSTYLFEKNILSPTWWMMMTGLGLYMGYIPFNSIFFDRMLAAFRYLGTVGFIMYVADAFGYLGSVGVLFIKEFLNIQLSWLEFYANTGYVISVAGTCLMVASMIYFKRKHRHFLAQR